MKRPSDATIAAIIAEVQRARAKFPSPNKNFTALVEEVGELAKALLENGNVQEEARQVAAMAIRVAEEGDPTLGVPPLADVNVLTKMTRLQMEGFNS